MKATLGQQQQYKREVLANVIPVAVSTSGGQILGPNARRIGLLFSCPITNRVTINLRQQPALDQGINLYPAHDPVLLLYEHFGQAVREEWYGIAATAGESIGILEVFEYTCGCQPGTHGGY